MMITSAMVVVMCGAVDSIRKAAGHTKNDRHRGGAAGGGLSRAQPKDVKDLNAAQQRTAVLILPFMLGHFNNHRLEVVVMNK